MPLSCNHLLMITWNELMRYPTVFSLEKKYALTRRVLVISFPWENDWRSFATFNHWIAHCIDIKAFQLFSLYLVQITVQLLYDSMVGIAKFHSSKWKIQPKPSLLKPHYYLMNCMKKRPKLMSQIMQMNVNLTDEISEATLVNSRHVRRMM